MSTPPRLPRERETPTPPTCNCGYSDAMKGQYERGTHHLRWCRMWEDESLAPMEHGSTGAPEPTPGFMTKEWCIAAAEREGAQEVGVGSTGDLAWQLTRAKTALENWGRCFAWCPKALGSGDCACGYEQAIRDAAFRAPAVPRAAAPTTAQKILREAHAREGGVLFDEVIPGDVPVSLSARVSDVARRSLADAPAGDELRPLNDGTAYATGWNACLVAKFIRLTEVEATLAAQTADTLALIEAVDRTVREWRNVDEYEPYYGDVQDAINRLVAARAAVRRPTEDAP